MFTQFGSRSAQSGPLPWSLLTVTYQSDINLIGDRSGRTPRPQEASHVCTEGQHRSIVAVVRRRSDARDPATRPRIQRTFIRSWDYIRPIRVTILAIRTHRWSVLWLVVLGAVLMSAGYTWGWTLLPAAAAMFALSVWAFSTAAKGVACS